MSLMQKSQVHPTVFSVLTSKLEVLLAARPLPIFENDSGPLPNSCAFQLPRHFFFMTDQSLSLFKGSAATSSSISHRASNVDTSNIWTGLESTLTMSPSGKVSICGRVICLDHFPEDVSVTHPRK